MTKIKQISLTIQQIELESDFSENHPFLHQLAQSLNSEALEALLVMHPIVLLADSSSEPLAAGGSGKYRVVSGKPQLILAKAILGLKTKIPVWIVDDIKTSKLVELTHDLLSPLFFPENRPKELRERVRSFPRDDLVKMGSTLNLPKNWSKLIDLAFQVDQKKPEQAPTPAETSNNGETPAGA
ncbi:MULTISPECIES: hypothetical protein [unclassified Polynucleobacter]|uniref:hypothetical protein n=1 Tax=unclassified Polynucleobacter TaxID=2640945 RepID=UPI0008C69636|nr:MULTISPECIES: hypothetical protein [unclassified Polynucleobacter]OHC08906.1 MAG: hypothetical protein A2X74_03910 [Polynucleobacter sp. GWA2_45_21]HBK43147.1 hypothetical protein [Polynucleobacter sp.]